MMELQVKPADEKPKMLPPVFRFAPSPNGYLHLGHALSALLNFDMARAAGGRLLLRIEDIDATRCRPEFETAIYEDLAWLGIMWETPTARSSPNRPARLPCAPCGRKALVLLRFGAWLASQSLRDSCHLHGRGPV